MSAVSSSCVSVFFLCKREREGAGERERAVYGLCWSSGGCGTASPLECVHVKHNVQYLYCSVPDYM